MLCGVLDCGLPQQHPSTAHKSHSRCAACASSLQAAVGHLHSRLPLPPVLRQALLATQRQIREPLRFCSPHQHAGHTSTAQHSTTQPHLHVLPVLLLAQLVAVACLYLACKVQESSKYLRDVIKVAETRKWAKWCEEHPTERRKWEDPVRPFLPFPPNMHSLAHPVKQAYTACCVLLASPSIVLICGR